MGQGLLPWHRGATDLSCHGVLLVGTPWDRALLWGPVGTIGLGLHGGLWTGALWGGGCHEGMPWGAGRPRG